MDGVYLRSSDKFPWKGRWGPYCGEGLAAWLGFLRRFLFRSMCRLILKGFYLISRLVWCFYKISPNLIFVELFLNGWYTETF